MGQPKTIYTLQEPCAECPFRSDRGPYLTEDRAQEIADALEVEGKTFWCHKTVNYVDPEDEGGDDSRITSRARSCAGSLIVMEKENRPNQIMRIAERLGLYDRTKLNMNAPVYGSLREWVRAHRR